jgi:HEAT repeat protein
MSMGSLSDLPLVQIVNNYLNELTSSDLSIRFNSADSLRKIFADTSSNGASLSVKEKAIAPMIEALSLDDSPTCDRIVWALECIGESAIKSLISATQSRIGKVQIQSIHALGKYISFPELRFRALEILHQDDQIEVRQAASSAINCFAQRIGMAKKHYPIEIIAEHEMIHEKLKCLLIKNLENDELKIPQFTQQALDWLEGKN